MEGSKDNKAAPVEIEEDALSGAVGGAIRPSGTGTITPIRPTSPTPPGPVVSTPTTGGDKPFQPQT